jgi:hypothetical protein
MQQIVHVDMDGVLYDYKSAYERERLRDLSQPFPQGLYRGLEPIAGAINGFTALWSIPKLNNCLIAYFQMAGSI